jgi:hypothetical protein
MWKRISLLYNRVTEPITALTGLELHSQLQNALGSKIYYTPKLQKIPFTEELAKYLRYLDRKDRLRKEDLRSLVEAILTEYGAVHGLESHPKWMDKLDYSITRNYVFK